MKTFILNSSNVLSFIGTLRKMVLNKNSMIFPSRGVLIRTSKFGNLRKITSSDPMKLTTHQVLIELDENGVRVTNPLNKGYGYSNLVIEFGTITFAYDSFFFKDSRGYWRQMKFSKELGWALTLTKGRTDTVYNPTKKYRLGNQEHEYELVTKYLGWVPEKELSWDNIFPYRFAPFEEGTEVIIINPEKDSRVNLIIHRQIIKEAFPMSFFGEERAEKWVNFCIASIKDTPTEKFIIPLH